MNILSLFDGHSTGRLCLERAGIVVDKYYSSEIDEKAIQISENNFDDIIRLGDITKIDEEVLKGLPKIDLIFSASPCQNLSRAGNNKGLEGDESKLFFEFVRILNWIRKNNNPNVHFLQENVEMKKKWRDVISDYLKAECMLINSKLVSAQNRPRLYWTSTYIEPPEDREIRLLDILEKVDTSNYIEYKGLLIDPNISEKAYKLIDVVDGEIRVAQATKQGYIVANNGDGVNLQFPTSKTRRGRVIKGKSSTLDCSCDICVYYDGIIRKFTITELERLQTLPTWEIKLEVELCLDQARNYVNAVMKNPKLQKLVLNVEKNESKEFVSFVGKNTNANDLLIKYIAPKNVDMQTRKLINKCTNHKKIELNLNANNVEKHVNCQNQNIEADSVLWNASMNTTQVVILHNGKEELLQKDNPFTIPLTGKTPLKLCGKEIMQLVKDVEKNSITKMDNNFTYTILNRLGIKNIEQMLIICYFYAKSVIDGCIANQMQKNNLLLKFNCEYTDGLSDKARIKAIGNGWTTNVIVEILKQFKF